MKKKFKTKEDAYDFFNEKLWGEISSTIQLSKPEYNKENNSWMVEWSYYSTKHD